MQDNTTSNEFEYEAGSFFTADKAPIYDSRFFESGINGLRALALLQIMHDVRSYIRQDGKRWQFYRKNLADRLRCSLETLDRATALLKEWGYLSVTPKTYRRKSDGSIVKIVYVWKVHTGSLDELERMGYSTLPDGEKDEYYTEEEGEENPRLTRFEPESSLQGGTLPGSSTATLPLPNDEDNKTKINKNKINKTNERLINFPASPKKPRSKISRFTESIRTYPQLQPSSPAAQKVPVHHKAEDGYYWLADPLTNLLNDGVPSRKIVEALELVKNPSPRVAQTPLPTEKNDA